MPGHRPPQTRQHQDSSNLAMSSCTGAGRRSKKSPFPWTHTRGQKESGCQVHLGLLPPSTGTFCMARQPRGASLLTLCPISDQVQLLPPPARLALRTVRGLHGLRRRQQAWHHTKPEPGVWLWLPRRRWRAQRERNTPRRRRRRQQRGLPTRDAEQEGPVQRRRAQRTREPERCADRWHHGQGARLEGCMFESPVPIPQTAARSTSHTETRQKLTRMRPLDDGSDR